MAELLYKKFANPPTTETEKTVMAGVNSAVQGLDVGTLVFVLSKWGPSRLIFRSMLGAGVFGIYKMFVPDGYTPKKAATTP